MAAPIRACWRAQRQHRLLTTHRSYDPTITEVSMSEEAAATPTSTSKPRHEAAADDAPSRIVAVLNFVLSLTLLLGAAVIILLALVGPKHTHRLSILYVEPIEMDAASIWVGVAQTCSRAHETEPVQCTPAARDYPHAILVTEKLASVLAGINGQAIVIAFLILSVIFDFIAVVVLLLPVYRTRGRSLRTGTDLCPHGIIIVFGLIACTWSAIAALVEHCVVPKALVAWNHAHGKEVGLGMHASAIYYLVVIVPIIQLFALFFAYRSMRTESYHDAKAKAFAEKEARQREKATPTLPGRVEIVHRSHISPLWTETILNTGFRLENGKTVYWVGTPTSVHSSLPPSSPGSDSFPADGDIGRVSPSNVGCAV